MATKSPCRRDTIKDRRQTVAFQLRLISVLQHDVKCLSANMNTAAEDHGDLRAEIDRLALTGEIWCSIHAGGTQPPMRLSGSPVIEYGPPG